LNSLRHTQSAQLQNGAIQWPDQGGYLDFILDDRNNRYVRFYVGQSNNLSVRLGVHCQNITSGSAEFLHYYIANLGDGHRGAHWMKLWSTPKEINDKVLTPLESELIQCFLEKLFCRCFECLPTQTLQQYFGPSEPGGKYAGLGLNVVTPLLQGAQLSSSDRNHFKSLLRGSSDPEIQSWPDERSKYLHRQKTSNRPTAMKIAIPPHPTAYAILVQEQLHDLGVTNCNFDVILSNAQLSGQYFDLSYQITKALGNYGIFTSPFGTIKAKVGVVLDDRIVDVGKQTQDSDWIPWLLRSAGLHQDNSLVWTFNHTHCGLYDPLSSFSQADSLKMQRQQFTRDLLNAGDLRVVLICGLKSQEEILAALNFETVEGPFQILFREAKISLWLQRGLDKTIRRILIRSPAPIPVVSTAHWRTVHKIGEIFRIVSCFTNTPLNCYLSENPTVQSRIIRQRRLENSGIASLWTLGALDPLVRQWLFRRGFQNDDLESLQKCNKHGSLARSLVVLLIHLARNSWKAGGTKIPRPTRFQSSELSVVSYVTESISDEEWEAVGRIFTKAKAKSAEAQQQKGPPVISISSDQMEAAKCHEGRDKHVVREMATEVEGNVIAEEHSDSDETEASEDVHLSPDNDGPPSLPIMQEFLDCEDIILSANFREDEDQIQNASLPRVHHGWLANMAWKSQLLGEGQSYSCFKRPGVYSKTIEMRGLAIKVPDGLEKIMIRAELAPDGEVHQHRFISKWLPEGEPALRLALYGEGIKSDGSHCSVWLSDAILRQNPHVTASRIFKVNSIVDWLEDISDAEILLRPHRWLRQQLRRGLTDGYSSSVTAFAAKYSHHW
jgi:hypothetical protein